MMERQMVIMLVPLWVVEMVYCWEKSMVLMMALLLVVVLVQTLDHELDL